MYAKITLLLAMNDTGLLNALEKSRAKLIAVQGNNGKFTRWELELETHSVIGHDLREVLITAFTQDSEEVIKQLNNAGKATGGYVYE